MLKFIVVAAGYSVSCIQYSGACLGGLSGKEGPGKEGLAESSYCPVDLPDHFKNGGSTYYRERDREHSEG